jgi:predicted ester cyclase
VSLEDNKDLVRRYYEDVVNTGAIEMIEDFIAREYVEVHDNERHSVGIEGARDHIAGVRRTYQDLELSVKQQIAEGEWVMSRVTMHGTPAGL